VTAAAAATDAHARSNLAGQAYARLKAELNDFALVPGDRFSEADLSVRLGVSRTPVREALFRLRSEGLLDLDAKAGWCVRPIDFGKLEQLYDLRVILELACVSRLCAHTAAAPQLDELKAVWLVPAAERRAGPREVGACDEQFHATLVRAAGNEEIARVHWDVTERIRIVRHLDFTRADRVDATYAEHAKILRAVIQRKADQARLLLKSHIEHSKAEVRKITLATLHDARGRGPASGTRLAGTAAGIPMSAPTRHASSPPVESTTKDVMRSELERSNRREPGLSSRRPRAAR
jgi:DNA-binding GntR family transcriptional regulator